MDKNAVVNQLLEAGARFLRDFEKRYPVAVAYWLKEKDESGWHLYVACPSLGDRNGRPEFADIHRVVAQMKDVYFDPFYVKLQEMDDPMVRFMMEFQQKFPGRVITADDVPTYFGVEVDGVYLYPPAKSVAA